MEMGVATPDRTLRAATCLIVHFGALPLQWPVLEGTPG